MMLHLNITIVDGNGELVTIPLRLHAGDTGDGKLCAMPYHYPDKKVQPVSELISYPIDIPVPEVPLDVNEPISSSGEEMTGEDFLGILRFLRQRYCIECESDYHFRKTNCGSFMHEVLKLLGLDPYELFPMDDDDCEIYASEFRMCSVDGQPLHY